MVDFIRDQNQLVTVKRAAEICSVHPVTIRRWFKDGGLEFGQMGKRGRILISLEALNRFQNKGGTQTIQAIVVDAETLAAIRELRAEGYKIGPEGNRDGRNNNASRQATTAQA